MNGGTFQAGADNLTFSNGQVQALDRDLNPFTQIAAAVFHAEVFYGQSRFHKCQQDEYRAVRKESNRVAQMADAVGCIAMDAVMIVRGCVRDRTDCTWEPAKQRIRQRSCHHLGSREVRNP